jgi:hypothetical protein
LKEAKSVRQKAMHTSEDLNGLNCRKNVTPRRKTKFRGRGGGRRRTKKTKKGKKKKNKKMCNNTECKGSEKGTEAKAREAMQKKKKKKKTTTTREGEHNNTTKSACDVSCW